mmetsp:Transcript_36714/g.75271  ORF Transcript_36714/g.75271 Transcript_36714/m.75271 type:complete len:86 (+) Transcript_36714:1556-1813(+)
MVPWRHATHVAVGSPEDPATHSGSPEDLPPRYSSKNDVAVDMQQRWFSLVPASSSFEEMPRKFGACLHHEKQPSCTLCSPQSLFA